MPTSLDARACRDFGLSSRLEWILTNGIGGYAMGTASGANTRRYHGLLVASLAHLAERMVLLANLEAHVTVNGESFGLSTNQYVGAIHPKGYSRLESFRTGDAAEWTYAIGTEKIVKRLRLHPGHNACTVEYRNAGTEAIALTLRPLVCHKSYHENFRLTDFYPQFLVFPDGKTILSHRDVRLTIEHPDADRTPTTGWYYRFEYSRESERGLDPVDDLYCPCELRYVLGVGESASIVAYEGDEPGHPCSERPRLSEDASIEDELERAAELFLVENEGKPGIIAGYPWFTEWGRDTAISVPGLCLSTGRFEVARGLLRGLGEAMKDGLVPNRFPDLSSEPEYHTVDATLWFANTIWLCLEAEWNEEFAKDAIGWLRSLVAHHTNGTHFGIKVDPDDGLLTQGAPGYQLTWMDAKVGDRVVTPRHGKPVEVNGLWVNALRITAALAAKLAEEDEGAGSLADRAATSFEAKFWNERLGHYLDTVGPDDASLRPNQVLAMALPFGPCDSVHAARALERVRNELLTPNGLRTLAPGSPSYQGRYEGSLAERDAAYHQGSAWPWLLGPYISATLKYRGATEECERLLSRVKVWLSEYGLGGIAEVYDGDTPQFASGCPWQAWSVAEVLRALHEVRTVKP